MVFWLFSYSRRNFGVKFGNVGAGYTPNRAGVNGCAAHICAV
jgi:hypothetical protein